MHEGIEGYDILLIVRSHLNKDQIQSESVYSISRDGPGYAIYVIHHITQSNLNFLTFIFVIYTRIPIYLAPTHPWK